MIRLRVSPGSPDFAVQHAVWWRRYHGEAAPLPIATQLGIWVSAETVGWSGLVSGCYMYPLEGQPYVNVSAFCVNPEAPGRARLKALQLTMEQILSYCVSTGRKPFAHTSLPGIERILKRYGFVDQQVKKYEHPSPQLVARMKAPVPKAKPRRKPAVKRRSK